MLSCVLIIPAALQAMANALAEVMGWGPDSYSVPLTDGTEPTHYGLHSWVEQSFVDMLAGASKDGTMPDELAAAQYPADDFAAVMAGVISSVRAEAEGHFSEIAEGAGLSPVIERSE